MEMPWDLIWEGAQCVAVVYLVLDARMEANRMVTREAEKQLKHMNESEKLLDEILAILAELQEPKGRG